MERRSGNNLSPDPSGSECDEIEPLLSLYCDEMTSTAETRRVDTHLEICDNCRKSLYFMKATYDVIAHRPVVDPPLDLSSRIRSAIAAEESGKVTAIPGVGVRYRFNPRPAYGMAAALLVAAVMFPIFYHRSENTASKQHPQLTHVAENVTPPAVVARPSVSTPVTHVKPVTVRPVVRAPEMVAKNNVEPVKHEHSYAPAEFTQPYHAPIAHPLPRTYVTLASNRTSKTSLKRATVIHIKPELVARATTPNHIDVTPPTSTQSNQVATNQPPTPSVPIVATPAPQAPSPAPVVVASNTGNGLQDMLHDAAMSTRSSELGQSRHTHPVSTGHNDTETLTVVNSQQVPDEVASTE